MKDSLQSSQDSILSKITTFRIPKRQRPFFGPRFRKECTKWVQCVCTDADSHNRSTRYVTTIVVISAKQFENIGNIDPANSANVNSQLVSDPEKYFCHGYILHLSGQCSLWPILLYSKFQPSSKMPTVDTPIFLGNCFQLSSRLVQPRCFSKIGNGTDPEKGHV